MSEPIEFEETTALVQQGDARRAGGDEVVVMETAERIAAMVERRLAGIDDPAERARKREEVIAGFQRLADGERV